MRRSSTLAIAAAAALLTLTACSSAASGPASEQVSEQVSDSAILLDVRTPGEYAAGRLDGAQLLDFNGGALAAAVADLDPDAEYLIYCRSGNRSGQAIALMAGAGFTNLTNLGSLEQAAAATGLAIVR